MVLIKRYRGRLVSLAKFLSLKKQLNVSVNILLFMAKALCLMGHYSLTKCASQRG